MKKRTIALVLAAVMILSAMLSVTAFAVELPVIPLPTNTPAGRGDADGDGSINARDVLLIMQYMVGKKSPVFYANYADYDGNGTINARDVLNLMLDIVNGEV
jgi:hypothetical protein